MQNIQKPLFDTLTFSPALIDITTVLCYTYNRILCDKIRIQRRFFMKKIWIALLLVCAILLSACNNGNIVGSTDETTTVPFEHPTEDNNTGEKDTTEDLTEDVCPGTTTDSDGEENTEDNTDDSGNKEDDTTTGNTDTDPVVNSHKDEDNNGYCDACNKYIVISNCS